MPTYPGSHATRLAQWLALWLALAVFGCGWLVRGALQQQREDFETDARIVHRLLSQRAVQLDAILDTLVLLQAGAIVTNAASDIPASATGSPPEQRLASVYPHILAVRRRDPGALWENAHFAAADARSRQSKRPVMFDVDYAHGRYWLLLAADTSYAMQIDMHGLAPWSEWPMQRESSPVRVTLDGAGGQFVLQAGSNQPQLWRFDFSKHLASDSQPFDVVAALHAGWAQLPWGQLAAWLGFVSVLVAGAWIAARQREARLRAEELLRLGQVARLNALGELAASMAHEINQPLAAILANTQAAGRLLADTPPDIDTARTAMDHAVQQAQRAAEVVGRLRRSVEVPDRQAAVRAVDLRGAVDSALYLLEPQLRAGHVTPEVRGAGVIRVSADPVAVEQIIHNLLTNALQALAGVPRAERLLSLTLAAEAGLGVLTVADSGPGIAAEALPRLFQPFYTTRADGLGLGLSLCESLASAMNGSLAAGHNLPRGAQFTLRLPLVDAA